jgi:hypothetical protein
MLNDMLYYLKRFFDPKWWRIKRMSNSEYWDYRDSVLCWSCDGSHAGLCEFLDETIYDDWTDKD